MEKMAMECSGLRGALKLADPKLWPIRGLLWENCEDGLRRGNTKFRELRIPLVISGTDLDNLKLIGLITEMWHPQSVQVVPPGIFAPKKIRGKNYVDGGIAAPSRRKTKANGSGYCRHIQCHGSTRREKQARSTLQNPVDDL